MRTMDQGNLRSVGFGGERKFGLKIQHVLKWKNENMKNEQTTNNKQQTKNNNNSQQQKTTGKCNRMTCDVT